ncbi:MAG: energy transducer TonB [Thermoanaerobaculia bacterium]|nr:energy transducer TonB [Thermoanaerobaculia bacterium]
MKPLFLRFIVLSLLLIVATPLEADVLGGETWTSTLRVRTIATAGEKGSWDIEVQVLDRASGEPLLFRSIDTYTGRTREFSAEGLDDREYRFTISIAETELETRLEIRDRGEPVDYLRALYASEPRSPLVRDRKGYEGNVMRVGGRVLPPRLIRRVEPNYPEEAKEFRVSGVVILEATIDQEGKVKRTRVMRGLPFGLSEAAEEAVKAWKYEPATMDGEPVTVAYTVTVEFNLHRAGE